MYILYNLRSFELMAEDWLKVVWLENQILPQNVKNRMFEWELIGMNKCNATLKDSAAH